MPPTRVAKRIVEAVRNDSPKGDSNAVAPFRAHPIWPYMGARSQRSIQPLQLIDAT